MENEIHFSGFKGKPKGRCYQILGFDILIDADYQAWLLEINNHPSLNINYEEEGPKGLIKEASPIDSFIKTQVVRDSIQLGFLKKKPEKFRGMTKLKLDPEDEEPNIFLLVKEIFKWLNGRKD